MTRTIGRGSMGEVLLADTKSHQLAVKSIPKKHEKVRKIAEAEKAILAEISHPLIVGYYGCIEDKSRFYLLFEYLPNGDLFHLMRRKRLKGGEIRFIAMEVAAVISYLHRGSIVYRDLKPENLMIDREGHIKLIDFGFAKKMDGEKTKSVLGSPEYMAPEMVLRKPHGLPVDCWSFGILLYELHMSHPPFTGDSPLSVYESILSGSYDLPSFLDTGSRDLIRRLLSPDPRFRPTIEAVCTHALLAGVQWDRVHEGKAEPPRWETLVERRKEEFRTDLFQDA